VKIRPQSKLVYKGKVKVKRKMTAVEICTAIFDYQYQTTMNIFDQSAMEKWPG